MSNTDHLNSEALILFLDGELTEADRLKIRGHLWGCETCRSRRNEFAGLSARVESLIASQPDGDSWSGRESVLARLDGRTPATEPSPSRVMKRFAWGMALAASLALTVVLAPKGKMTTQTRTAAVSPLPASSIQVDGENFVALPYSNPDLPVSASRIVEMQVPVSSLAAAGIVLAPYPDGTGDRMVPANVLLGLDGQPLAVHVLNAD